MCNFVARIMLTVLVSAFFFFTPLPLFSDHSQAFTQPLIARGDYDYPPFEYLDKKGHPTGFNIDLLNAIAEEMNLSVVIDLGLWSQVRNELTAGEVDLITGMYQTEARQKVFDFSSPHNVVSHALYVKRGSSIQTLDELKGCVVYVESGDVMHDYLRERIPEAFIVKVKSYREALVALNSDLQVDAVLTSRIQGERIREEEKLNNIITVGPPFYPRKYCFAVQKGNSNLLAVLNDGITILRENGTYDRLYEKWFGKIIPGMSNTVSRRMILIVVIAIAVGGVITFTWIWSLKRSVRQKTAQLKKELTERKRMEWRFRSVFEGVPVSIWEEDISTIRERIRMLREEGISDFSVYVNEHPEIIDWMVQNIKIVDVNPATLAMHNATSKEQLIGSFAKVETRHIKNFLRTEFLAIAEGQEYIRAETKSVTFSGEEKIFLTTIFIPRTGSGAYSHMLVSMVDITEIKKTEKKLAKSLEEKEVLLKELHHRVKNNMQMMSSLINLQSRSVEDRALSQVIRVSENRIRAMALVHELLYQTDDFTSIELGFYLRSLVRNLMDSFRDEHKGNIRFDFSGSEINVTIDTAIPCGLIVNELVSNSLEHAFPNGRTGTIKLKTLATGGFIMIEISDDGCGIAEGPRKKKTMGLDIVHALVQQLRGTIDRVSFKGGGTKHTLRIRPHEDQ